MKKALALVLALVMTLSLCACGQKETTPDTPPSTTGDGTTTVADANKDADIYSWMLYYFEGMTDVEIGKLFNTSRSTIQYRRTSSFEILKKYLEEHADEWDEW